MLDEIYENKECNNWEYSDYEISKYLGITHNRVNSLKFYPKLKILMETIQAILVSAFELIPVLGPIGGKAIDGLFTSLREYWESKKK